MFFEGACLAQGAASEAQVDVLYRQIGQLELKAENDFFGTKPPDLIRGRAERRALVERENPILPGFAAMPAGGGIALLDLWLAARGQRGGRCDHDGDRSAVSTWAHRRVVGPAHPHGIVPHQLMAVGQFRTQSRPDG